MLRRTHNTMTKARAATCTWDDVRTGNLPVVRLRARVDNQPGSDHGLMHCRIGQREVPGVDHRRRYGERKQIPLEFRPGDEVINIVGVPAAPEGTRA